MIKSQHPAWLLRIWPMLLWKDRVTAKTIRADLLSGITVAIVVVPQAVAFASIAGMPPQYGLYAGMIPPIIAALFGSSWHLMSGPTTAASIVLLTSLSAIAQPLTPHYVELALTLTFMVGMIELVLGLVRMGTIVNFISHSVVVGFTTGAAILIASKQLKNFFGVSVPRGGHLFETISNFWHQVPQINGYVTSIGIVTLLSGFIIKKWVPRIPYLIVALLAGSFMGILLNSLYGHDITAIKTVGAVPQTFPPLSMPDFSLDTFKELMPAAFAMTLFALTEAVSIARALSIRSGQFIDPNQEFIGQGLSNIAGSFFSGYVATGSFNRSSLNYQAGAKTPISAMIAGFLEIFIVLTIAPLVAYLPNAAMAGILFIVAWGLIDIPAIKHILRSNNAERSILLVTFASCLLLDLEFAILSGILLSLVLYLMKTSQPRITIRVPDPYRPHRKFSDADGKLKECPQLHILRIDGSLFFGSESYLRERFIQLERDYPERKHLIILAEGIHFVDLAGAAVLGNEAKRRRMAGGGLYLVNVKPGLWDSLEDFSTFEQIDSNNIFQTKPDAILTIFQKLDHEICRHCQVRAFFECATIEYADSPEKGQGAQN